jgi:hypothetical protein
MVKGLSTDTILIAIAIVWSLCLPFYPDTLFVLLDGIVGVFFLLFAVLIALPYGTVPGVLVLVAVALTFVERNRRKINTKLLNPQEIRYEEQMAPPPPMSPDEVHPAYEYPQEEELPFYPEQDASDTFEAVGRSINDKQPIKTLTPYNDASERLYVKQHLGDTELRETPRVF